MFYGLFIYFVAPRCLHFAARDLLPVVMETGALF